MKGINSSHVVGACWPMQKHGRASGLSAACGKAVCLHLADPKLCLVSHAQAGGLQIQ